MVQYKYISDIIETKVVINDDPGLDFDFDCDFDLDYDLDCDLDGYGDLPDINLARLSN